MAKLEKYEERKFVRELKKQYGLRAVKFSDPIEDGGPDRLVLLPGGKCLWLEFKRIGGIPRDSQLDYHNWLWSIGHKVHVVDSCNDALHLVAYELNHKE